MSSQTERRAAQLFEEYLDDTLRGKQPSPDHYLSQCPASEVEELKEALSGVDVLVENYYCPRIKASTVDRIFEEVQATQQKQRALRQARERAKAALPALGAYIRDPPEYLRNLLDFPAALLDAARQSAAAVTGGRREFATMNRGVDLPATQRRGWIDEVQLRAIERTYPAKAEELLEQVMVTAAPVDVVQVAEELGLFVQEARLPEGMDGCIVTDGTVGGILINRAVEDPRRRRFTLAHEIGHFVLHKDVRVLPEGVDEVGSFFHSQIEREANAFAGYLLMPPFLMPAGLGGALPSLDQADTLVERFDVSLAAALRRVVRESDWRCAMVVTQDGAVRWAVRSQGFEGFIETGKRPHQDTVAALLLRTGGPDEDRNRLPAEAWTEGALVEEEAELWEESRRVENGYVYTLLRVIEQP